MHVTIDRLGKLAILHLSCLSVANTTFAEQSPDEIALSPGDGFLLIRLICNEGERVGRLDFKNLQTGVVITTRTDSYKSAGHKAWMALLALPEGRYFWSEYEHFYRIGNEQPRLNTRLTRTGGAVSTNETFEVVSGVINYAGDWVMRINWHRLDPIIGLDMKTLERLIDRYPDHVNKYEVYLSMMGKKAISLMEFQRIVKELSE